jgi:hypothetical protein
LAVFVDGVSAAPAQKLEIAISARAAAVFAILIGIFADWLPNAAIGDKQKRIRP